MPMQHTSVPQLVIDSGSALIEQAQLALDTQRWLDAAGLARQATKAEMLPPQHPLAHLLLARALWHQGDLVECCRHALRAEQLARQLSNDACAVQAVTLAAFALTELNLEVQALPLAQRALATAQRPGQFQELPAALSCLAHVHARQADLENADAMHMRALSLARESNDWPALQMAYDNLLVSFVIMLRSLEQAGDAAGAAAVVERSRRYTSHIRSLLANEALEPWRRGSLMCNLGELLYLSGKWDPAQALLEQSLALSQQLQAGISDTLTAQTALADLLHRRGQHEVALKHLQESLSSSSLGEAGYLRQLQGLQIAEACYQALGRTLEAQIMTDRIHNALQLHEQMRAFAKAVLPPTG